MMGRIWKMLFSSQVFYFAIRFGMRQRHFLLLIFIFLFTVFSINQKANAACGATTLQWDASTSASWNNANNWTPANIPGTNNNGENAVIIAASTTNTPNFDVATLIGCFEVQSGRINCTNAANTITITRDYFRADTAGSLVCSNTAFNTTFLLNSIGGITTQYFDTYDDISNLTVQSNTTVQFSYPFRVRKAFQLTGTTTYLNVMGDLNLENATAAAGTVTIPAGVTVEVASGVIFTVNWNLTINGTLILNPGAALRMGNGKVLTVGAAGLLKVQGSNTYVATVDSTGSGATYQFVVNGKIYFDYFRIQRFNNSGTEGVLFAATAIIQALRNGEFHFPTANKPILRLNDATSVPSTMNSVGFFSDGAATVTNISVTATFAGAISLNDFTGDAADEVNDVDPNNRITWGTPAPTAITLQEATATGNPPGTIAAGTNNQLFASFAFALTNTDTSTDIRFITVTQSGTASSADISDMQIYVDDTGGTNCTFDAAFDYLAGQGVPSGNPMTLTAAIPAGKLTLSNTTLKCVHVRVSVAATAIANKTIQISIESTGDILQNTGGPLYNFSVSSGPPVIGKASIITSGTTVNKWDGGAGTTAWNNGTNWMATVPTNTQDCEIGAALQTANLNTAPFTCRTFRLLTGGTLNYNGNTLTLLGNIEYETGATASSATGTAQLSGNNVNRSIKLGSTHAGNISVNLSAPSSGMVTFDQSGVMGGNLTLTAGTIKIPTGVTLEVQGNITLNGGTLQIDPGATLKMANTRVLTVNNGATLKIVGTSTNYAMITSNAGAAGYNIIVNNGGTIEARYYMLDHLGFAGGLNGLTINATANINAANHLQDGTFNYPVVNNVNFLRLFRQIPSDILNNMTFDGNCGAAGIKNINLDNAIASDGSDTLSLDSYTGCWTGVANENDTATNYSLLWNSPTNTINGYNAANAVSTCNQGDTAISLGRFRFVQTQAGGSFANAGITSLKLTMTGTGTASDISQVRIYYDSACSGTGGSLIGSGFFSGSPGTKTFTMGSTEAIVHTDVTTPPNRCIYVQADISATASVGSTVGVKINSAGDFFADAGGGVNYALASGTPAPISLGTTTINAGNILTWTGATSTAWNVTTNWSPNIIPTNAYDCVIDNQTRDPIIPNGYTASCRNLTNDTGILTMNATSTLQIYGNFTNNGTFTQNGQTLTFVGTGTQTLSSSNALTITTTGKTSGIVQATGTTLTLNNFTLAAGTAFTFQVTNGTSLVITNGMTQSGQTFIVNAGGTVKVPSGQTITINGGTFAISGTNDAYPQNAANKGKITNNGAGRWLFNATAGTVDLSGFIFDMMDATGLRITGTTTLAKIQGGQFTNLDRDFTTPVVRAIFLNTSVAPTLATASNVGFNWGAFNNIYNSSCAVNPCSTDNYYTVETTSCGSGTLTFDQWFGDFYPNSWFVTEGKIQDIDDGGSNCQINMDISASPVSLLKFHGQPYNQAVRLSWETGFEKFHQGFNVYRSTDPTQGYTQVNTFLVRSSGNHLGHGLYHYTDSGLSNSATYYYRVEDVATNGARVLHPDVVVATPELLYGNQPDDISGNPNTPPPPVTPEDPPTDPTAKSLGNGVYLSQQTANSFRIEIVPGGETFTTSNWSNSYETVAIAGYSSIVDAGKPELLERTILVQVGGGYSEVTSNEILVEENTPTNHKIAPAPTWKNVNGKLMPFYNINSQAYRSSDYLPQQYYSVLPTVQKIANYHYVKIKVNPILFLASASEVKKAKKIILDIALSGDDWQSQNPAEIGAMSPATVSQTLRIKFDKTGMYALHFNDLVLASVHSAFDNADVNQLSMYYHGEEIPIEIESADGFFNAGDVIYFLGNYAQGLDDKFDEVVLSQTNLAGQVPKRIQTFNASPTNIPGTPLAGAVASETFEQNLYEMFDSPLGTLLDHIYWKRLLLWQGASAPYPADSFLTTQLNLPGLVNVGNVNLRVYLSGRGHMTSDPTHHLGVYLNNISIPVGDIQFSDKEPITSNLQIPANYFVAGVNTITFQALADLVPTGEADVVYINKIQVEYTKEYVASNNSLKLYNHSPDHALTVSGFMTNDIRIYDASVSPVVKYSNLNVSTPDGGATYTAQFNTPSGSLGYQGYALFAYGGAPNLSSVSSMELSTGYPISLKSPSNKADFLVIGAIDYINAASTLISKRQSEGLSVAAVTLDQIYAEFSNGRRSSQAIKDFLSFAFNNWQAPSYRYVLLLGDATTDPKNELGYGLRPDNIPVPIVKGTIADYGSDNWFADFNDSTLPNIAIGRIPASSAAEVIGVINKILDYEAGSRAPSMSDSNKLTFVSDVDPAPEYNSFFNAQAGKLVEGALATKPSFSYNLVERSQIATAAAAKAAYINAFDQGPLVYGYIGHGAYDTWSGTNIFTSADADALTNTRLPIVLSLNCDSGNHYLADSGEFGMGEKLILNPKGGAVAFWGSTTLTYPSVQVAISSAFMGELGQATRNNYYMLRLGDVTLQAKQILGTNPAHTDTLGSWVLLGDPTMTFPQSTFTGEVSNSGSAPSSSGGKGFLSCGSLNSSPLTPTETLSAFIEALLLILILITMKNPKLARIAMRKSQ